MTLMMQNRTECKMTCRICEKWDLFTSKARDVLRSEGTRRRQGGGVRKGGDKKWEEKQRIKGKLKGERTRGKKKEK